ncbi:enoyl-CoA hydratase [Rhodococcus opacus]|uniref:Enoyl-CoA hydratase n=1 Tax=Rhodococcus opacus TaxID=37919 RepID=A0A2S8J8N9_RHOOP|nr:enoyl-CoA hydratase [Rhodococcus opacus]PQP23431.1 enoyl-CoA hydratase [Rhodococcus opacus]
MKYIRRENPAKHVARVVLARPEARNAQTPELLYELDAAFTEAVADRDIKVIMLAGDGPDFSSGHDVRGPFALPCAPIATIGGDFDAPGVEGRHRFECEAYIGLSRRWRDIPKPTIAEAHGRSIAGALMLLWPMDIIVAGEGASFADPVVAFNLNGHEYFTHAWEVGARKAKEMLYTGDPLSASDAYRLGMVNHVIPDDEVSTFALQLAEKIAAQPAYGLQLAKESVNQSLDAQGQSTALEAAFSLHTLGHANNLARFDDVIDPAGIERIRDRARRSD